MARALPWLNIVRAARLAIRARTSILAAIGLFLTAAGWKLLGWAYSSSDDEKLAVWRVEDSVLRWETPVVRPGLMVTPGTSITSAPVVPASPDAAVVESAPGYPIADASLFVQSASPFFWLSRPFVRIFDRTAGIVPFSYALLCGLWSLAVWALVGGAITRIVALALAHEGRLGGVEGTKFAVFKWHAFFLAPLFPLLGVLAISLVAGLFYGLIMRADVGLLAMSILWPLMIAACFVMTILLLGLMFGWPLMWPTISVEGTDSFNALSRSYSYTFQRPFHYLFYAMVAGFIGALASLLVTGLAHLTIDLGYWSISWGAGLQRANQIRQDVLRPGDATGLYGSGLTILGFWEACVLLLGAAFLYSYFWSAATAIYFLLRRHVDGTEMDEVWSEPQDEMYGLPPLKDDPSGVPQVDDSQTKPGPAL